MGTFCNPVAPRIYLKPPLYTIDLLGVGIYYGLTKLAVVGKNVIKAIVFRQNLMAKSLKTYIVSKEVSSSSNSASRSQRLRMHLMSSSLLVMRSFSEWPSISWQMVSLKFSRNSIS